MCEEEKHILFEQIKSLLWDQVAFTPLEHFHLYCFYLLFWWEKRTIEFIAKRVNKKMWKSLNGWPSEDQWNQCSLLRLQNLTIIHNMTGYLTSADACTKGLSSHHKDNKSSWPPRLPPREKRTCHFWEKSPSTQLAHSPKSPCQMYICRFFWPSKLIEHKIVEPTNTIL